ncbi:MAG: ferrous iron transport protein A [Pyrinomonadaceae bacterium]|nr:ferrous iron transport protein A [Phycisphaerales bacterium]
MPHPADSETGPPFEVKIAAVAPSAPAALSTLKRGQTGVLCEGSLASDDAAMLRAMGLHPAARIRLCRVGEPCIVSVTGRGGMGDCGCGSTCRIGLAKSLAARIFVTVDK